MPARLAPTVQFAPVPGAYAQIELQGVACNHVHLRRPAPAKTPKDHNPTLMPVAARLGIDIDGTSVRD